MNSHGASSLERLLKILKKFLSLGFIAAAVFGVTCAFILFFTPDKISKVTDSISAFGNKGYKLPEPAPLATNSEADLRALKAFSKVFVNIGKATRPALVFIQTKAVQQARGQNPFFPFPDDFFFPFQNPNGRSQVQQGAGSGFIVDLNLGYVITNNHVIEGADEITVNTFDDRKFKGRKVGSDKLTDVAVVKIENFSSKGLKQVAFGDSDAIEVGDWVVALGAPFELPQTLTVGVVSATGRTKVTSPNQLEDFIQTDAAINPGNSGGPLLNIDGKVIGINTAILSRTGAYAGIGFAVPSNMAKMVAEMLINEGKVTRGFLGIGMSEIAELSQDSLEELRLKENTHGVMVRDVVPGGPADRAGLKPYDVIQIMNGTAIHSGPQLRNRIAFTKPGTEVKLVVLRDGATVELTAVISAYSEEAGRQSSQMLDGESPSIATEFGMSLRGLNSELRQKLGVRARSGVVITEIEPDSIADSLMLMSGDVIVEINRKAVKSVRDVEKALNSAKEQGKDLLFLIERDGRNQIFNFRLR